MIIKVNNSNIWNYHIDNNDNDNDNGSNTYENSD